MRLKKEDPVIVITGNDKGKEGKIVSLRGDKVVVKGVNQRKKHQKAKGENRPGSIITFDAPIHISNVRYCVNGEAVKLRVRQNDEEREIYCRTKNNEEKVIRTVK